MNTRIKTPILLVAILLIGFPIASIAQANTVGKPASDFTIETHDGKQFTLSKLEGKRGTVLVFFATWCPSCMAEVPEVKKFVTASADKNVLVYGVNIQQSKRIVERFVKDRKINYRILLDTDAKVAKAYGITGIPTVIGIDAKGVVGYREYGMPRNPGELIKTLTASLGKTAPLAETTVGAKKAPIKRDYVKDGVHYISKETLTKWMGKKKKPLIIDVLSPRSYKKGHIKGAINIPLKQLKKEAAKLDKSAKVVVYCANYQCHASTQAAKLLGKLGFKNVYDYKGGIKEWNEAKLAIESERKRPVSKPRPKRPGTGFVTESSR